MRGQDAQARPTRCDHRGCVEPCVHGWRLELVADHDDVAQELLAKVAQFLGDHPTALSALEDAVRSTPGGVIGRYLLGTMYLNRGDIGQAQEVLRPVIEQKT